MICIATAGDDPPPHVVADAAAAGIELMPQRDLESTQDVVGYLMNSFGRVPPMPASVDLLRSFPALRLIVYLGQSLDPMDYAGMVDLAELRARGIPLLTTPAGDAVAEAAIGMMIAADLNLVAAGSRVAARDGKGSETHRLGLAGAVAGIVGPGQIGTRVAELAAAFGMQIQYASRQQHGDLEHRLDAKRRTVRQLCGEADFITVHTSNSAPEGLINSALEAATGAVLINTTSAPWLVDPAALLAALEHGRIRRAFVEGDYPEPWQSRLVGCGVEEYVSLPIYSSWDTPSARAAGWAQAIAGFAAADRGEPLSNRLV